MKKKAIKTAGKSLSGNRKKISAVRKKNISASNKTRAQKKGQVSPNAAIPVNPLAWMGLEEVPVEKGTGENCKSPVSAEEDFVNQENSGENMKEDFADEGFGFFSQDEKPDMPENTEQCNSEDGFGFFDQDECVTSSNNTSVNNSTDDGFGFFDNAENTSVTVGKMEVPVCAEDGFGFFSSEDDETGKLAVNDGRTVVDLEEMLTVKNIEMWYAKLMDYLHADDELVLDGRRIDRIDGCGIQLLCSFQEAMQEQGARVHWLGMSAQLKETASYLGVTQLLAMNNNQKAA